MLAKNMIERENKIMYDEEVLFVGLIMLVIILTNSANRGK